MAVAAKKTAQQLDEPTIRKLMGGASTGVAVGIALGVLDQATLGSLVTVTSLVLLIYAVHSFGRVGADRSAPARRRRRRK